MILQLPLDNQHVAVLFRLPSQIWADSIYLVGDFNCWNTSATPMRRGEQYWEATVTMPAGSTSYYAYLVDGKDWCSEYRAAAYELGGAPPPVNMLPIEIAQVRRSIMAG